MNDKRRSPDSAHDASARPRSATRRRALKGLTAAGGAVVVSHWSKPIIDTVVLPAHAQATGPFPFVGQGSGTQGATIAIVFS